MNENEHKATKHILVFDSGLGGTTVLRDIQNLLPACRYSYALDNSAFPYSNKSDQFLISRILKLFTRLIPYCQPDLVVIACNTASTLVLEPLRQHFELPFVGVVPAIKPAAAASKSRVIGLLATEATVNREYIQQLHAAHAEHCEMICLGSQRLVEIAENKMLGKAININDIRQALEKLQQHPQSDAIDVFILGCTHFPAIRAELAQAWGKPALWIDSGTAIARRVEALCRPLQPHSPTIAETLFLTSRSENELKREALQRFGIRHCHIVEID